MKKITLILFVGLVCIAFTMTGCDKLSFLEDYFPSMKRKVVVEETATTATPKKAVSSKKLPANVLAKVNDWTLTVDEFDEKLKGIKQAMPDFDEGDVETKKLILDELVRQQLLVQDAIDRGIDKKKEIIEAMAEFKNTVLVQQLAMDLAETVTVSDAEAEEFYKANEDYFRAPDEWRISEIVVEEEPKAKEVLVGILQGQDFSEAAKAHSKSKTASAGGDTGFVAEFTDPQVQNMVLSLEEGATSSVFKGAEGFYIIKLEEKKGGELKPLSEIKEELKEGLMGMKQQQVVVDLIDKLSAGADIEIREELIK